MKRITLVMTIIVLILRMLNNKIQKMKMKRKDKKYK